MSVAFGELVDLVLPRRCVDCRRPGTVWCARCRPAAAPFAVDTAGTVAVFAATAYTGATRRALLAYKERGRRDLAGPLATLLATAVRAVLAGLPPRSRVVLVAPPSARVVVAARGGDHVLRLARRAALGTPIRAAPGVLRSTRRVRDSAGLGIAARERNLHASMVAAPPRGRVAVVVDDIVTTGATMREAVRALRAAGWPVAGAATVAATPRHAPALPLAGPR